MTTPGLNLTDFRTTFPEFSAVSDALINTFLALINNGYQFITNNVTSATTLNVYYWLVAHFVATATIPVTGAIAGAAGSYLPSSTTASKLSVSFQAVQGLSMDQVYMNSTRYGEVFWTMSKQLYVQNFYLNQWSCW